jgi:hypothetical protein
MISDVGGRSSKGDAELHRCLMPLEIPKNQWAAIVHRPTCDLDTPGEQYPSARTAWHILLDQQKSRGPRSHRDPIRRSCEDTELRSQRKDRGQSAPMSAVAKAIVAASAQFRKINNVKAATVRLGTSSLSATSARSTAYRSTGSPLTRRPDSSAAQSSAQMGHLRDQACFI